MSDFQRFLVSELDKTKPVFNNELMIEIGNKIKQLRVQKDISQLELSKMSGVPQSKISRIENGSMNITLKTLENIFSVLGYKIHVVAEKNGN